MRISHLVPGFLLAVAVPVLAAPADIVRTRIAGFRELGVAFKAVNDGLRGEVQLIMIRQSAREIRNASLRITGWFPPGSGAQAGEKTAARPEIWKKKAIFKTVRDNFIRQADVFQKAAAGTDPDTIRAEAGRLGETCKACHEQFRVPKES